MDATAGTAQLPFLLLLKLFVDDSGSISSAGNAQAVRDAHNKLLDDHMARTDVLISTQYLNGDTLFPFSNPTAAVRMTEHNYNPNQGTPLYRNTPPALLDLEREAAQYADRFDVHTYFYVLTDGEDSDLENGNNRHTARHVKEVVDRMFASGIHAVWGMGVSNGRTDFERIFLEMGIAKARILVMEGSSSGIARGMDRATQTSRATVDRGSFTHTSRMGFGGGHRPPHDPGTARPFGGRTAPSPGGSSTGPRLDRSPEEKGEVERGALLWQPFPNTFLWEPGGAWKNGAPNPIAWSPIGAGGYFEIPIPPEGEAYVLGRFSGDWEQRMERERSGNAALAAYMGQGPVLFVPLTDKRMDQSPISGTHALIVTRFGETRVFPLSGAVANIPAGDSQYSQAVSPLGLPIATGTLLGFAPGVVLRVK